MAHITPFTLDHFQIPPPLERRLYSTTLPPLTHSHKTRSHCPFVVRLHPSLGIRCSPRPHTSTLDSYTDRSDTLLSFHTGNPSPPSLLSGATVDRGGESLVRFGSSIQVGRTSPSTTSVSSLVRVVRQVRCRTFCVGNGLSVGRGSGPPPYGGASGTRVCVSLYLLPGPTRAGESDPWSFRRSDLLYEV